MKTSFGRIHKTMGNSSTRDAKMVAFVREGGGMRLREDYPQPRDPAHGEASVKILAAGINPVDYKAPKFLVGPIVGLDFCGIIEVAGEGSPFKEGDRVFGTTRGSLAEKALCKCSSMAIAPADLSHEMSAAMPTAYAMARRVSNHWLISEMGA